jgi:hypothetical protein
MLYLTVFWHGRDVQEEVSVNLFSLELCGFCLLNNLTQLLEHYPLIKQGQKSQDSHLVFNEMRFGVFG